jgi:hypothetical protein
VDKSHESNRAPEGFTEVRVNGHLVCYANETGDKLCFTKKGRDPLFLNLFELRRHEPIDTRESP